MSQKKHTNPVKRNQILRMMMNMVMMRNGNMILHGDAKTVIGS